MKSKVQKKHNNVIRHIVRLLKVLSKKPDNPCTFLQTETGIVVFFKEREYAFTQSVINSLVKQKYIILLDRKIQITEAGSWFLKSELNPDMNLTNLQGKVVCSTIHYNDVACEVSRNLNESPLSRLFTRKTKSGKAYLSQEEFEAGERFRRDFERGQLQPRISASLSGAMGASGSSHLARAGDISDFAVDARNKINKAIVTLGPELSGIALDICCFLKGLEAVERERSWPPRSAKLMLKTALSVLARYYGISGYQNTKEGETTFWGSSDYRPSL